VAKKKNLVPGKKEGAPARFERRQVLHTFKREAREGGNREMGRIANKKKTNVRGGGRNWGEQIGRGKKHRTRGDVMGQVPHQKKKKDEKGKKERGVRGNKKRKCENRK